MDKVYEILRNGCNSVRNVFYTIGDGVDFFAKAFVNLKRARSENESLLPPPNPLADPQSRPVLSQPPTLAPSADEERPSKRRRLSVSAAPRTSLAPLTPLVPSSPFAPPILPAPATPSALPSTPFVLRRSSSGLPDALQAPTPPDLAFTSRSRFNAVTAARPPLYPSARQLILSRPSTHRHHQKRSSGQINIPPRRFSRLATPTSKPFRSPSMLRPPSRVPGPLLKESKVDAEAQHAKRPSFLPPRPSLTKTRRCGFGFAPMRPRHLRVPSASQSNGAPGPSNLQQIDIPSVQARPPVPANPAKDTQPEYSDSTDPERVLDQNILRQKASVSKERESERQSQDIALKIRQQNRYVKEQRFRRQALQRSVISRLSQHLPSEPTDTIERPPPYGSQFEINYYEDVEGDALDWDERTDSGARRERQDQVSVIGDNNHASGGPHQVFTSAFAPLTSASLRRLRHYMCNRRYRCQELNRIRGMVINGDDIVKLKPSCWLNDEIINSYFQLLVDRSERNVQERSHKIEGSGLSNGGRFEDIPATADGGCGSLSSGDRGCDTPRVTYINSFFYSRLVSARDRRAGHYAYDYDRVRRWTRRNNVFSYDIMLVPINQQNLHWSLGVINFMKGTVTHLDSMGGADSQFICEDLLRWVNDEARDKGVKNFDPRSWKIVHINAPQQCNSDDCGVFTCKFGDWVSRGWKNFTFTSDHMNYFRSRIAHELLMGRAT